MIGKRLHVITIKTSQNESDWRDTCDSWGYACDKRKEMAPFGRVVTVLVFEMKCLGCK